MLKRLLKLPLNTPRVKVSRLVVILFNGMDIGVITEVNVRGILERKKKSNAKWDI